MFFLSVKAKEGTHDDRKRVTVNWRGQNESTSTIFMVFTEVVTGRDLLESRERLEDEGTKRTTTTQSLKIIQKVRKTFIYLNEESRRRQDQQDQRD